MFGLYRLHFPGSIERSLVSTHAQDVGTTAREIGPAGLYRMFSFLVGSVGQKKKCRENLGAEPNLPRCN